ncbi:hypothetical protein BVER_02286 [Candidatus Burkholderia verschuerenii]|uniref:Retrotransposon gag domain-containing protein n=1 Tax=Candidatus Burkholderia verschuerenii TaxID=242163 RepID=A0A0L0M470_9BURK|nr:retrotransposon gag family protein [Candidatus Burkholderia verschuerenii]KND56799.1 hypothetical protein BVER_02286 [Candidatus Burkholderia verschuerenii]
MANLKHQGETTNPNQNRGNPPQEKKFGAFFEPKFDRLANYQEEVDDGQPTPPHLISLIVNGSIFQGLENEDPTTHLTSFLNMAIACKPQGMPQDRCNRVLFPFSLRGQASYWYESSGLRRATNFEDVRRRFLTKYYPPNKVDQLRMAIHQFRQFDGESISTAWERFQELLNKCPNLLMEEGAELHLFYQGLNAESQGIVNASAGGSLVDKSLREVRELMQRIASNGCK